jgi:short-chain fatty acids transporter
VSSRGWLRALGALFSRIAARWVPDPFAIALALTVLTFGLAWLITGTDPMTLLGAWGGRLDGSTVTAKETGIWRLIAFAMQMCLILVTGYALASAAAVRWIITRLAGLPRSNTGAIVVTALTAMGAAWINWGLGLIVGALVAREVARTARERGIPVHYPLIGAAGYTGLMVWHGGLSGTAPFKVTQGKDIAELLPGVQMDVIGLDATVFSGLNLIVSVALLILVPFILVRMSPPVDEMVPFDPAQVPPEEPEPEPRSGPAGALENSRLLAWGIGAGLLVYLVRYLSLKGFGRADVNAINLLFLALGLILHQRPIAYARAIGKAASGCAGIILQFPFYAGIMALMAASGLMALIAQGFAGLANETTFGPLTFLSAGIVNLFVPSGGGQWGVQGSIVMQTADALGVDLGKAVMAFAYGDGWTNMLQPFWALPLLAITGLKARDLVGYTAALMVLIAPVYIIALMVV